MARKRMVIKVGSQVLCESAGGLSAAVLAGLARQIAALRADGWEVVLVSSGAVAAGVGVVDDAGFDNPVTRRQVLAAAGQVRLMATWGLHFADHDLAIAQVLASKGDFQSRGHYLNMRGCLDGLLSAGLLPVVNENDVVSVTELMFTDNDELAGLVAAMVGASHLCLLTTVAGVLDAEGALVERWDDEAHDADALLQRGTSTLGRGGMHSKLATARKAAGLGIETLVADGRDEGVLASFADGAARGTVFPARGQASSARRWLASMDGHTLGAAVVNAGAEAVLTDPAKLASVLPVGVEAVEGEFLRGDVIEVRASDGRVLGCGRSQYDHAEARAALGQRDMKPLIHYDYLYLRD